MGVHRKSKTESLSGQSGFKGDRRKAAALLGRGGPRTARLARERGLSHHHGPVAGHSLSAALRGWSTCAPRRSRSSGSVSGTTPPTNGSRRSSSRPRERALLLPRTVPDPPQILGIVPLRRLQGDDRPPQVRGPGPGVGRRSGGLSPGRRQRSSWSPASRLERSTTVTELSDIASAAISGPYRPKRPAAARGMPTLL